MIDTSTKSLGITQPRTKKPMTDEEYQKSKCRNGPNQKCINFLGATPENA